MSFERFSVLLDVFEWFSLATCLGIKGRRYLVDRYRSVKRVPCVSRVVTEIINVRDGFSIFGEFGLSASYQEMPVVPGGTLWHSWPHKQNSI